MRKEMKELNEVRKRFRGIFERFGTKTGWEGREVTTLLLKNIIDLSTQQEITDHLWFVYTKRFQELDLKEGVIIEFDARVKEYLKGYKGYRENVDKSIEKDYKLSHPTKIFIIPR